MKKTYKLFIAIFQILIVGCSKESSEENAWNLNKNTPIDYSSMSSTRGAAPITSSNLSTFGVFCYYTGTESWNGTTEKANYMNNQRVEKVDNAWSYSPIKYWPNSVNEKLSFFAYTPYAESNTGIEAPATEYTSGLLQLRHTPNSSNITYQVDLCIAQPVYNKVKGDGAITFQFAHTLTQISFAANYAGSLPTGYAIKIDELKIKNVIGSKLLSYCSLSPYYTWQSDQGLDANVHYDLTRTLTNTEIVDMALPQKEVNSAGIVINDQNGRLYLLPQTLTANAQLEVTYSFYQNEIHISQQSKIVSLPVFPVWEANKSVKYLLTIHTDNMSEMVISATSGMWINDWISSGNIHEDTNI